MRSIIVSLILMCGFAAGQVAESMGHEVKPDRTVVLWFRAPNAKGVRVRGNLADGVKEMVKGADGVWTVTMGPLQPAVYRYSFTVDGLPVISVRGSVEQFEVKLIHGR
jgi:enterochelin esterase family protein